VNRKSGISLLDVIIIILIVGVIAALVMPKTREKEKLEAERKCRENMELINKAMVDFFSTGGEMSLLEEGEEVADTTESGEEKESIESKEEAEEGAEEEIKPKLFTDDIELLRPYLPDDFELKCPLDGKEYIIHANDSVFYSISCPNGHGQIIKGELLWEEE
jgi:type II secretory pathway pseudopilin PulG